MEKQQLGHDITGMMLHINFHGNTCGQTDARPSGASTSSCAVINEHLLLSVHAWAKGSFVGSAWMSS